MSQEKLYKVILGPHISEKASIISEQNNQWVFKIAKDANKRDVKLAVEKLFEVSVESVQIVNIKGKTKRTVRGLGKRNDVRKAYVRLAEGQSIDFVDVE